MDALNVVLRCSNTLHQLTEKYTHTQGIPEPIVSYRNIIQEPKLCDPSWNKKTMKISKNFPHGGHGNLRHLLTSQDRVSGVIF